MTFNKSAWSKVYHSSPEFKEHRKLLRNTPEMRAKANAYQTRKRREAGSIPREQYQPDLSHLVDKQVVDKRRDVVLSKGQNHECALCWSLKSPDGQIFQFKNLRMFVQTHRHLFTEDQLKLQRTRNTGRQKERIIGQLAKLSPRSAHNYNNVHGWTWHINNE